MEEANFFKKSCEFSFNFLIEKLFIALKKEEAIS